jgi:RNA polymerase sigma-70 factor (ECF subfamily)
MTMSAETQRDPDAGLLAAFTDRGDRSALDELFRRRLDRLFRVGCRACGNASDAEDAVQSAFLLVLAGRARFRGTGTVAAWLAGIVINLARRQARARGRRERHERESPPPPPEPSTASTLGESALAELQALPERYRLPVWMRYGEGMAMEDIGTALSLAPATVRTRLKRGLDRLRERLAPRRAGAAGSVAALLLAQARDQAPAHLSASLRALAAPPASSTAWTPAAAACAVVLVLALSAAGLAIARHRAVAAPSQPEEMTSMDPLDQTVTGSINAVGLLDGMQKLELLLPEDAPLRYALPEPLRGDTLETFDPFALRGMLYSGFMRAGPHAGRVAWSGAGTPLRGVLDALARAAGASWSRHGDAVVFTRRSDDRARLEAVLSDDQAAPAARGEAALALARSGDVAVVDALLAATRSSQPRVAYWACRALDELEHPYAAAIGDHAGRISVLSAVELGASARQALTGMTAQPTAWQAPLVAALAWSRGDGWEAACQRYAGDRQIDLRIRLLAAHLLVRQGRPCPEVPLDTAAAPEVMVDLDFARARAGDGAAVARLVDALHHGPDEYVSLLACDRLASLRDERALQAVLDATASCPPETTSFPARGFTVRWALGRLPRTWGARAAGIAARFRTGHRDLAPGLAYTLLGVEAEAASGASREAAIAPCIAALAAGAPSCDDAIAAVTCEDDEERLAPLLANLTLTGQSQKLQCAAMALGATRRPRALAAIVRAIDGAAPEDQDELLRTARFYELAIDRIEARGVPSWPPPTRETFLMRGSEREAVARMFVGWLERDPVPARRRSLFCEFISDCPPLVVEPLLTFLERPDIDAETQVLTLRALARQGSPRCVDALARSASSPEPTVREAALAGLRRSQDPLAVLTGQATPGPAPGSGF